MTLDLEKIRAMADRVASSHGLSVVEVEYIGNPKNRGLRIYIEKDAENRAKLSVAAATGDLKAPENLSVDQLAGITVDDCQVFSDDFGTVLDVEELVPGSDYTLEVSSPGLDRKLYGLKDYERFAGSLVKLRTCEPVEGNSQWQGRIANVGADSVELDVSAAVKRQKKAATASEKSVTIAFSNISRANLVPEL
jgi:ribosome maturation factor RimP